MIRRRTSVRARVRILTACTAVAGVLGAAALTAPGTASAVPTDNRCAGAAITTFAPSPGPLGWTENLTVDDDGGLWVSRVFGNVVDHYDRAGRKTTSIDVESPGAVRPAPDGRMYVTSGNTTVNLLPGMPRTGTVLAFDPRAAQPKTTVIARGFAMPNGLAVDEDGSIYIADSGIGLVRLHPDGSPDPGWTARAPQSLAPNGVVNGVGFDGIAIHDDTIYTTTVAGASGRVLAVPVDAPARVRVVADLTGAPAVLDDLAVVGPSSSLALAVTTGVGDLHLVDLTGPRRCVIPTGAPLTAVAVDPDNPKRLYVTSELGDIREITLR